VYFLLDDYSLYINIIGGIGAFVWCSKYYCQSQVRSVIYVAIFWEI